MIKVYRCKLHNYDHPYTVCPDCGCQYCPQHWPACPRTSWHPGHGSDMADAARRFAALPVECARSIAVDLNRKGDS